MAAPTPQSVSPVYMSGPMFSVGDKHEQKALAEYLEQPAVGMKCYLPQRDGIEVAKLMKHVNDPEVNVDMKLLAVTVQFLREIVFAMDEYQLLSRCKSIVFNMDGRVPDDGSISETAAGWASGQPIVIYKTTPITMLGGTDNPMVDGLSMTWALVSEIKDVPQAILTAAGQAGTRAQLGQAVTSVVNLGEFVWGNLAQITKILNGIDPSNPNIALKQLYTLCVEWEGQIKQAFPNGPNLWPSS